MAEFDSTAPVTRAEFSDFRNQVSKDIGELGRHIEDLLKARQVSWPLILSAIALVGAAAGFGIKNLSDVIALRETAASTSEAVDSFRERIRALEAAHAAGTIENETQNRWMADVVNVKLDEVDRLLRLCHPEIPAPGYYPLKSIGGASPIPLNGRK